MTDGEPGGLGAVEAVRYGPRPGRWCRHVRYYREKSRERFLTLEEFRYLGAALRTFEATG